MSGEWDFQQLHPTLARGKLNPSMYDDEKYVAEEKYDGDRRIGQFCPHPELGVLVRFTGRRVSDVDGLLVEKTKNVPHLSGDCVPRNAPSFPIDQQMIGTVFDGEFITKEGRSKDVTSIMGSLPERAWQLQMQRGWIEWAVFDCLFYKGQDLRKYPWKERRGYLSMALTEWGNPYAKISYATVNKKELLQSVMAKGGEGIILKHRDSHYDDQKNWVKVKKELTEDVVLMGYDLPKETSTKVSGETSATKYASLGWIGAVRFGQYKKVPLKDIPKLNGAADNFHILNRKDGLYVLVYCGSCSGMDDELRQELSENKTNYLGSVVEILANDREPTGKFRHPRWVGFRDNKNHSDCLWTGP